MKLFSILSIWLTILPSVEANQPNKPLARREHHPHEEGKAHVALGSNGELMTDDAKAVKPVAKDGKMTKELTFDFNEGDEEENDVALDELEAMTIQAALAGNSWHPRRRSARRRAPPGEGEGRPQRGQGREGGGALDEWHVTDQTESWTDTFDNDRRPYNADTMGRRRGPRRRRRAPPPPPPVNCQWGPWTEGECSKTCGGGNRTDTRVKTRPESNGGTCTGESSLSDQECNDEDCPTTTLLMTTVKAFASRRADVCWLAYVGLSMMVWLNFK